MPRPMLLSHRGDARTSRQNTLEAFEAAIRAGCDGIELDVRRSGDDLVVHHDATLRIRGRKKSLRALSKVARPTWLPSLRDVVHWIGARKILVDVELKEAGTEAQALADCTPKLGQCVFTSFHPDVLHRVRELEPSARIGWISKSEPEAIQFVAGELRPDLVVLPRRRCTGALVGALREAGFAVWAWKVNSGADAQRLEALGVEAFITDRASLLVRWRARGGPPRTGRRRDRRGS